MKTFCFKIVALEIIRVIITFSDLQIDIIEECLYILLVKLLHTENLVTKKKVRYL